MSTFKDVDHIPLRVYNRCIVARNIREDAGLTPAEEYIAQFSHEEQVQMHNMFKFMKGKSRKQIIETVTKGLTFKDD